MGDFYVLCNYCLLLQNPGMPKHKKDSWQLAVNKGVTGMIISIDIHISQRPTLSQTSRICTYVS